MITQEVVHRRRQRTDGPSWADGPEEGAVGACVVEHEPAKASRVLGAEQERAPQVREDLGLNQVLRLGRKEGCF